MSRRTDVRKWVRIKRTQGWAVSGGGRRHWRLDKDGAVVIVSVSPSCSRWRQNAECEMRRALRKARGGDRG